MRHNAIRSGHVRIEVHSKPIFADTRNRQSDSGFPSNEYTNRGNHERCLEQFGIKNMANILSTQSEVMLTLA